MRAPRAARRRHRGPVAWAAVWLIALSCVAVIVGAALSSPNSRAAGTSPASGVAQDAPPPEGSPSGQISVRIDLGHPGPAVAPRFLGLSFEVSSLPLIARYARRGDLVALLRSLGPGVMRFGGASSDWTTWTDRRPTGPLWPARTLSRADFTFLAALARRAGWQVLLGVDLARYNPQAAAREVAVARRALRARLSDIVFGNEPDTYGQHGLRALPWGFEQYAAQIGAYRRRGGADERGVAVAGPDVSGAGGGAIARWLLPEALLAHPALLTGHYYSLSCRDASPPTISELLGSQVRAGMQRSLAVYAAVSRAARIPFRVDEANTVSCGGQTGVSNTFASALWAADFLVRAMVVGASGVNLHGHLENCGGYAPLCATTRSRLLAGDLAAQPEWYALLFVKPLIGDRPVHAVMSVDQPDVDVMAFRHGAGGVHVVIVDTAAPGTGPTPIVLSSAEGFGRASAVALSAPSLAATAGVTLGGRTVTRDGAWRGPRALPLAVDRTRALRLEVQPGSALLITLSVRDRPARASAPGSRGPVRPTPRHTPLR